jgi:MFS family permease
VSAAAKGWRQRPAGAAYAGHFLFGIVMALLGAILPALSLRIGIDLAQAGTLFLAMNACILASSFALGPAMDRFGMKPPLVIGPVLAGAGLAAVALARHYEPLVWGMALLGLAGGALNGSGNTLVADLHEAQEARSAALNLLGVFYGIGALFIPLAIGLLLAAADLVTILLAAAGCAWPSRPATRSCRCPSPSRSGTWPWARSCVSRASRS